MGSTFSVKGTVTTEQDITLAGVEVHAFNKGSFEKPEFNVIAISDEHGYFETESVFSYACSQFQVEISAEGYQKQQLTFYPPGKEFSDELPETLDITLIEQG